MSNTDSSNVIKINSSLQRAIEAILSDRPIAYHPALARALGSVTAGVFLSQLLYWTPRSRDSDCWVWKTQEQVYQETALTRTEQETARRILRTRGVLEEKRAGVPARLFFRVNMERLTHLLAELGAQARPMADTSGSQFAENPQSSLQESRNQDRGTPPNKNAENRPTTSEITSEITSNISKFRKASAGQETEGVGPAPQAPGPNGQTRTYGKTAKLAGFRSLGVVLDQRRHAPPPADEDRQILVQYISDFAGEFGDQAPLRSSTSRAVNLYRRSGLEMGAFTAALYQARTITKEHWGAIRSAAKPGDPFDRKTAKAYYFGVLEHLLGFRELPETFEEYTERKEHERHSQTKDRRLHSRGVDPPARDRRIG